ncbi:WD40 repeat protein [Salix suchowensis]|nr:WD40 repeat protein [Salix suchowensis]
MDFTEIYKQTSSLVEFSAGAHFIATAVQDRLIIRRADSFQITRTWLIDASPSATSVLMSSTKGKASSTGSEKSISHIGWSCDSEYLFAACAKSGTVQIFKLAGEEWTAHIDSGAEGLVKAEWAPDGRTVLCFSEWGLRVTLWSLVTGRASYLNFPIHPDRGTLMPSMTFTLRISCLGYTFRADGRYLILAERHKSKDTLGLYDAAEGYKPVRYKLYILSLNGDLLGSFAPDHDPGFGIRGVAWHPTGMFLAVGGWDDKVYILDSLSWGPVAMLELTSRLGSNVEPSQWVEDTDGRDFFHSLSLVSDSSLLVDERIQGPQTIPIGRVDHSKLPKAGIVQMEWNKTGTILMARYGILAEVALCAPPFVPSPASTVESHPQSIYTWSDEWLGDNDAEEEMAECIGVPTKQFQTRSFKWAPDGKGIILFDQGIFCCAFEVQREADSEF